ncbi:MAG: hypothetical protein HZA22_04645 [Nitrospirae bacterium]|nr:hypothetical protein [Nitrospirota bacterium]
MADEEQGKKPGLTAEQVTKLYKSKLAAGVLEGKTGLASELIALDKAEQAKSRPKATPLEKLKPRGPYHMSEAAVQARKDNAKKSTGPTSAAGKAISSRNARSYGQAANSLINRIIKPCFSTCEHYAECEFVEEGRTSAGGDCLDREHVLEALSAIGKALKNDRKDFEEIMQVELAGILGVVQDVRDAVTEYGVLVKSFKMDADGGVIAEEWKLNPALLALPKLIADLGITFKDWNLTPAAIAKVKQGDDAIKSAADIMGALMGRKVAQ